ncbi:MAG: signal peptidase I [Sulfolobus sp.]|nr:signal peptidase I [Sulfolobus sp.]
MRKSEILVLSFIIILYALVLTNVVNSASVEGVSMYPVFQNGAITFYVKTHVASLGDIIIFRSPTFNTYVIHRVVAVTPVGYITKGVDPISNPQSDAGILEPSSGVPPYDVLGKVTNISGYVIMIPYLGYISILFSSFISYYYHIINPITFVSVMSVIVITLLKLRRR